VAVKHLLICASFAFAASSVYGATLSGVVLSTDDSPIRAAAVRLPRLSRGALVDSAGVFLLHDIPTGEHIVVASSAGFLPDTQRVRVTAHQRLIFTLVPEPFILPSATIFCPRVGVAERTSAFVETIRPEEIASPTLSVPELLDETVGVQVQSQGGHGSFTTVSIRGSTSEQVRVYLDGVPLNQALGGGVNIGTIPTSNIEEIEVYRGVIPPEFGGSGTAGVVNLRTRSATDSVQWKVGGSYGTWNTRMAYGWLSRGFGPIAFVLSVDYSHSDNNFSFRDDNGTLYNEDDDEWAERTNNQFTSLNVLSRISSSQQTPWRWTASYNIIRTDDHLPGMSTAHALKNNTSLRTDQQLFEALVGRSLPLFTEATAQVYHSRRDDRFDNSEGYYGLGKKDTRDTSRVYGGKVSLSTLALTGQRLAVDGSYQWESYVPDNLLLTNPKERERLLIGRRRWQTTMYLSDEIRLFGGWITVTGQVGHQYVSSRTSDTGSMGGDTISSSHWPLAAGLTLQPVDWMAIRGNVGRYMRVPNMYELFGDRGTTMGNEDLLPETGINRDVGVGVRGSSLPWGVQFASAEAVYFDNSIDDMIIFWQISGRSKPFNMSNARIRGVELSGALTSRYGLSLSGNLMWQCPLNKSTALDSLYCDKDLPGRPRWQVDMKPELTLGPVKLTYSVHWHNRFYAQPLNRQSDEIPSAWLHDIGVQFRLGRFVTFTGEARNLTDVKEFHTRFVPLPGRSWFVSLQAISPR